MPVCLSLQLWFRGNNNNHDQEKKEKPQNWLPSLWRGKNKRTMEQEELNIDPVWCRRQINQVITEQRWEAEKTGRLKKGGMEAVQ